MDKAENIRARFASAATVTASTADQPTRIDEAAIERLRHDLRPSAWLAETCDITTTGFRVRKQSNSKGARLTFNFVARNPDNRLINITIGPVGVLSIDEARQQARVYRRQIVDGLCPATEKDRHKRQQHGERQQRIEAKEWTVRSAIQAKLDDASLRDGSKDNYRSLLNVALKDVADKRLDDIGRAEWKQIIDKTKKSVSAVQAQKVARMASALYNVANETSDYLKLDNPLATISVSLDDGTGQRRTNRINDDDFYIWLRRLNTVGSATTRNLALFTLFTAMREAEARLLRWDEIHGDDIIIPAERIKVRKPLRLPITNAMSRVLEKQRGRSKVWVFPSPHDRDKPISPILPAMKQLGHSVHDLRRTALSIIDSLGVPSGVRRAIANHAAPSIADGYVVAKREDVLAALRRYHAHLDLKADYGQFFEGRTPEPDADGEATDRANFQRWV